MGAGVAPPLTLVTLDRTPFIVITKSVGEAAGGVYSPAVLRLRDQSLEGFPRIEPIQVSSPTSSDLPPAAAEIGGVATRRGRRPRVVVEETPGEQCRRDAQQDLAGQRLPDELLDAREAVTHGPETNAEDAGGRAKVLASAEVRRDRPQELFAVARCVEDPAEFAVDRRTKQPLVGQERTLEQQVIGRMTPIEPKTFGDEKGIERRAE